MDDMTAAVLACVVGAAPEYRPTLARPDEPLPPPHDGRRAEVEEMVDYILSLWPDPPKIVYTNDACLAPFRHSECDVIDLAPFYHSESDAIFMPPRERFYTIDDFYVALLHEMAHSTGRQGRYGRLAGQATDLQRHTEELVAELTSIYVADCLGLSEESIAAAIRCVAAHMHNISRGAPHSVLAPAVAAGGAEWGDTRLAGESFGAAARAARELAADMLGIWD
jgi:hypothetical protein